MTMPPDIEILIGISRHYGGDPAYFLAGGGNTSIKHGDRLWVKASGNTLAAITAEGFVELNRTKLDAMLSTCWPEDTDAREAAFISAVMDARIHPELGQRPSVETLLHHLLPDRFVVYCRSVPMWVEEPPCNEDDAVKQWRHTRDTYCESYGFEPWIGLIAGVGAIAIRKTQRMADTSRQVYLDAAHVYYGAARLGGVAVMSIRDRRFIENWEVEAFRRNVSETSD